MDLFCISVRLCVFVRMGLFGGLFVRACDECIQPIRNNWLLGRVRVLPGGQHTWEVGLPCGIPPRDPRPQNTRSAFTRRNQPESKR